MKHLRTLTDCQPYKSGGFSQVETTLQKLMNQFFCLLFFIMLASIDLAPDGFFSFILNSGRFPWIWESYHRLYWHRKYVRFENRPFKKTILVCFPCRACFFLVLPRMRHQEEDLRQRLSLAEPHKSSDLFSERFEYHHVAALIRSWWPCLLDLCHMAPCLSIGIHTC